MAASLLYAIKVQAQLVAGAHAQPLQAEAGRHSDADAGCADCEGRQMFQLVSCKRQRSLNKGCSYYVLTLRAWQC